MTNHPAKYTDKFIPIFADKLKTCQNVIDVMGGTGKIGRIKEFGFKGTIYCNELEVEWLQQSYENGCDILTNSDASNLNMYEDNFFDAICTSPTYGNRMADSHNAKDSSVRNTYTHKLGRKLNENNTGKMQWGEEYRLKHLEIYTECHRILKKRGKLIINIKDHIRKGAIIKVTDFHIDTIIKLGFELDEHTKVETKGNGFGSNSKLRVGYESILEFVKL